MWKLLAVLWFLAIVATGRSEAATPELKPADSAMFFVDPGKLATLDWLIGSSAPAQPMPFTINDYTGLRIDAGNASVNADGHVTLTHTFARGYYDVVFPEAHQTFGVVALEASTGPADPFFCMDSGLTWLEDRPDKRTALVKILSRCGIAMSRERLSAGSVNPNKDKWDWEGGGRANDTMRKTYAEYKVPILELLLPGAQHLDMSKDCPYPQNLVETAAMWKGLAAHWGSNWGGAEVWNEPDLVVVPADQYATVVKAASYAMTQAHAPALLVSGVFATAPPGTFFESLASNGVLDDSDVIGLHSYDKAPDIEGMVVRYRAWLKSRGKEALPLWHTECGFAWKNGTPRPPVDQDALSALEITAKAIETRACGIARHFPFVYVYYEEGEKNFGMMGKEVSPLRSMAGYATCAHFLSGKEYLGDLPVTDKRVKLARVFGDPVTGACVAMIYTGSIDPKATFQISAKIKAVFGIDGRELAADGDSIPIYDGLCYLNLQLADIRAELKTDTRAAKLFTLGKEPLTPKRMASPIVLQFQFAKTPLHLTAGKYLVAQDVAKNLTIYVRIHNLSPQELTVEPSLQLPVTVGARNLDAVKVPGLSALDVAWVIDASKDLDIADTRLITVTAKTGAAIAPTPLAIPLMMEGTLDAHLARHTSKKVQPATELKFWKSNIDGSGSSTFSVTGGAWKMNVMFPAETRSWVYPIFTLQSPIDPAVDTGFLLRARIAQTASNIALLANPNQADGFWISDIFPADGEWHVVYIPFEDLKPGPGHAGMQNTRLNPALWKTIAIGMACGNGNSLEIDQLVIVGTKK